MHKGGLGMPDEAQACEISRVDAHMCKCARARAHTHTIHNKHDKNKKTNEKEEQADKVVRWEPTLGAPQAMFFNHSAIGACVLQTCPGSSEGARRGPYMAKIFCAKVTGLSVNSPEYQRPIAKTVGTML